LTGALEAVKKQELDNGSMTMSFSEEFRGFQVTAVLCIVAQWADCDVVLIYNGCRREPTPVGEG
jgi:hypothetical protein